jgi:prepilin-type N-terminal cleavage/methylation domain-containing protein/prepilin-type processing-associated H-X9-DG protein
MKRSGAHSLQAFTLVEVLVVVGIIGILAAVAVPMAQGALDKARQARETHAAKSLIAAYLLAAGDNENGELLPGMDYTVNKVWFEPKKKDLTMMHVANRYPFRLAPYFSYQLEGTILVNGNGSQIASKTPATSSMYDYMVSAFPALGINYYFVGGLKTAAGVQWADECVTRLPQAGGHSPLVFASGGTTDGMTEVDGFNILTPPRLNTLNWTGTDWSPKADPGNYGNVDARYNGKAVCAFLDGSVRMLGIEELRDMRLWSKNAAAADDAEYTIAAY